MSVKCDNHFLFSDTCYYDLDANTVTDISNDSQRKNIPISGEERTVLRKLIEAYPKAVHKERLCTLIGGTCGEERIRKVIDKLKKRHKCLKDWLPRASQGEYRLQNPNGSSGMKVALEQVGKNAECTLKNTGICVRPNFVKEARLDIFDSLDKAFDESHVVFLQGIGGIGKSEAAKHWALQKKKERLFDTVVFAQLNSENENSNVQSLIADDTVFVISGAFRSRDEEETTEAYFQRKLAKIKQITDERTLVIIDNYDIDDPKLAELFTGPYRLLVTTRNKQAGYDFPLIPVAEIQEAEHLKDIFFKNLGDERDDIEREDPYIEKLFALVSNHTLTIEIIAKALVNSSDTLETLYQKIGDPGQHTLMRNVDGLVVRNFSEKALTSYECIRRLFNLSRLEQDEDFEYKSQVLVFLAAMPTRGIELSLFKKWSDNQIIRAKNSLVQKSWLRQDTIKGVKLISMHPLIREIVWSELEPGLDQCTLLVEKFMNDKLLGQGFDALYHQAREVKELYETVALSLLASFPHLDNRHIDFYFKLQMLFHYSARADYALSLANTIKEVLESANETNSWKYGHCLLRIGLAYEALLRDDKNAIVYLKKARDSLERAAVLDEEWFKLGMTYRALATTYCRIAWDKKETIPMTEIQEPLTLGDQIVVRLAATDFSKMRLGIFQGTLDVWRSKFEVICGNLDRAEMLINRAEEAFVRYSYANAMDKPAIFDIRALIHSVRKAYAEEIECLIAASRIHVDGFGEYHRAGIERGIRLATAYQNNGQPEESIKVLNHYQKIAEEMLGDDAALSVTIRNQLNQLLK